MSIINSKIFRLDSSRSIKRCINIGDHISSIISKYRKTSTLKFNHKPHRCILGNRSHVERIDRPIEIKLWRGNHARLASIDHSSRVDNIRGRINNVMTRVVCRIIRIDERVCIVEFASIKVVVVAELLRLLDHLSSIVNFHTERRSILLLLRGRRTH